MLVSFRLPNIPRPKQQICVIGDAAHNDEAESKGVPHMSADDLKKLNKDKVRYVSLKNAVSVQTAISGQDLTKMEKFVKSRHRTLPILTRN